MLTGMFNGRLLRPTYDQLRSADYWLDSADFYSENWPEDQKMALQAFKKSGARIAYWRSNAEGKPCNGGSVVAVYPGLVETAFPGTVALCTKTALHATLRPPRWNGSRLWVVALVGVVVGDDEKFGSATRAILGEAKNYPPELMSGN